MIKTLFLVPVHHNAGQRFDRLDWDLLEQRILDLFGGYTKRAGPRGAWQAGGRVYHDRSREFTISLTSWRQLPAWLDLEDWACRHFRQEAIYGEVASIPKVFERTDR